MNDKYIIDRSQHAIKILSYISMTKIIKFHI